MGDRLEGGGRQQAAGGRIVGREGARRRRMKRCWWCLWMVRELIALGCVAWARAARLSAHARRCMMRGSRTQFRSRTSRRSRGNGRSPVLDVLAGPRAHACVRARSRGDKLSFPIWIYPCKQHPHIQMRPGPAPRMRTQCAARARQNEGRRRTTSDGPATRRDACKNERYGFLRCVWSCFCMCACAARPSVRPCFPRLWMCFA